MASQIIEIELDEFSNHELISEIDYRINKATGRRKVTDAERKQIALMINGELKPRKISLINQMKIDFLNANIEKVSLEKLESLIQQNTRG